MPFDPFAAKKRVDEALEMLRIGLSPFVLQRMIEAFGKNWRPYASRAAVGDDNLALDVYALLKTVLDNWRGVFDADAKLRKARSFISLALDARNKMSHFAGTIEQREAVRYLDAILEVLRAVDAIGQAKIVNKLYVEQQTDADLVPRVEDNPHLVEDPSPSQPTSRSIQSPNSVPRLDSPAITFQTQADRIRSFALEHYIVPAKHHGLGEITIRTGDIHRDMGLYTAMPAVCSALGGSKFTTAANVMLIERIGPMNGANVYFRFSLDTLPVSADLPALNQPTIEDAPPGTSRSLDLSGALVLVSCVKSKLAHASTARTLYTSTWFIGVRDVVESSGARWFLLSSLYGLVAPDTVIAPYEFTLNSLGVQARIAWAKKVLDKLVPETAGYRRVVMFAGYRYREFLIEPLKQRGIVVDVPMKHLRRGEQLAWLRNNR